MDSYDQKRQKRLIFLGQRDFNTQTDDFIFTNSDDLCISCNISFTKCQNDHNDIIRLYCGHNFCTKCLQRLSAQQIQNENNHEIKCPICSTPLNDSIIEKIDPTYVNILNERFSQQFGRTAECPKCHAAYIIEPGKEAHITHDQNGEKIRPEALECFRQYRVTCSICKTNFCANCKSIPFHEGFTCDEQKLLDEDIICRFCQYYPAVGCRGLDACHQVCWHSGCQECMASACMHVCDCGHACCGLKDEQNHFGCAQCDPNLMMCAICNRYCYESPSVLMKCGHPVHKKCLESMYKSIDMKKNLIVPRCNYNRTCQCVPYHECVKDVAQQWIDVAAKIDEIIEIRMKIEDTEHEPDHVKNPADPDYFNEPKKYARDFFVFYLCDKCKQPYYAGHKDCGNQNGEPAAAAAGGGANPDDGPHECLRCNRELLSIICPKHGELGMVFKCMFCCSPSIWLCYGNTTYFCDPCHQRAGSVEHSPSFPKCDGHCKFAPHVPNGQRTVTGYCVLCEQEKENQLLHG